MEQLLNEAHAGNITVITSSFALVEVLKVDGHKPLTVKEEQRISDFFEYPFIRLIDPTRSVAESARHLIWKHPALYPKDALHIASALAFAERSPLDALFSYDSDFTKLNGVVTTKFPVQEPFMNQPLLALGAPTANKPVKPDTKTLAELLEEPPFTLDHEEKDKPEGTPDKPSSADA